MPVIGLILFNQANPPFTAYSQAGFDLAWLAAVADRHTQMSERPAIVILFWRAGK
jgi:hypothetical protein